MPIAGSESETGLRLLIKHLPVAMVRLDLTGKLLEVSDRAIEMTGYTPEEVPSLDAWWPLAYPDPVYRQQVMADWSAAVQESLAKGTDIRAREYRITCKNGDVKTIAVSGVLLPDGLVVVIDDISEHKLAEDEHRAHLKFLESLDRVNRAIQGASDLDQVMSNVLGEVLDIFGCDRAFLLHPCDPGAPAWSVRMERTRPEYPGALALGQPIPMDRDVSTVLQALLDSPVAIRFGAGNENPLPKSASEQFGFKSFLSIAIRPKNGAPWQFGIHQCSYERKWTDRDVSLFEAIAHRLADGLDTLLVARSLGESEERFRLVFENSPLPIHEDDFSAVKRRLDELRPVFGDDIDGYFHSHPETVEECAALIRPVDLNRAALQMHGATEKDAILRNLLQIFAPESMVSVHQVLAGLARGQTDIRLECELRALDGRRHNVSAYFTVCPGYEQTLGKVLVSLVDITERKHAERERHSHVNFLVSLDRVNRAIQSAANLDGMMANVLDTVLEIFACDRAYLHYPCDPGASEFRIPMERCNPAWPSVLKPGQTMAMNAHFAETLQALLETDHPIQLGPNTDRPIPAETTDYLGVRSMMAMVLRPLVDSPWQFGIHQCSRARTWNEQEVRLFEEIGRRISDGLNSLLVTRSLRESEQLFRALVENSPDFIARYDRELRRVYVNPALQRIFKTAPDETLGRLPTSASPLVDPARYMANLRQAIEERRECSGELAYRDIEGKLHWGTLRAVPEFDANGTVVSVLAITRDISVIKEHEADLDRIAHYDTLTSVPNRRLLSDRMEQAIARSRRHGSNFAVCYLDLDGFKPINDQFGHEGGDLLLIEIAHRLQAMSRADDTVARLGGDEFVLLWNDIGAEAHCTHALERVLAEVSAPVVIDGISVSVSASIGVTLFPDDNVDADSLLRHADHAMYSAKQLGKNRYQMFDSRLEQQISSRVEFLSKVSRSLDRGQFELFYQPKVDCVTGKVVGVEALVRWNEPILGLLGPKEFLPLIEDDNLAFRMGRWVMEEAVRQARRWHEMGIELCISINVFPRHLKYPTFIEDLRNAVSTYWPQMPRDRLMMEIVETSDLEELDPIEEVIKECLQMGIPSSLDDFGTGYSSLIYLRRLSVEELKIDQSFVRDMLEDPDDRAIVVGVIGLGKAFGLRVVAEGVESQRHARHLIDLGCTIVQGYGLGHPMPVAELQKWLIEFQSQGGRIWR
jgi:diguanylate cyclase (GGDEF)-like protein/PAS domain S-box-containing protein